MNVQHYLQPLSSIAVIIFRLLQWLTVSLVEYCKWVLTFMLLFLDRYLRFWNTMFQKTNVVNVTVGETEAQQVCFQNGLSGFGLLVSPSKGRCLRCSTARRTETSTLVSPATQTSRCPATCGDTAKVWKKNGRTVPVLCPGKQTLVHLCCHTSALGSGGGRSSLSSATSYLPQFPHGIPVLLTTERRGTWSNSCCFFFFFFYGSALSVSQDLRY